jgi:hypothetical protein
MNHGLRTEQIKSRAKAQSAPRKNASFFAVLASWRENCFLPFVSSVVKQFITTKITKSTKEERKERQSK